MFIRRSPRRPAFPSAPTCLLSALACAAFLTGTLTPPARCQALVTSRAALPVSDPVDWAVLGENVSPLGDPLHIGSSLGLPVTVTQAGRGAGGPALGVFGTILQAGVVEGEGTLLGNFAPGDTVLDAESGGAVSLTFPHGVYGGGAQVAAPAPTRSGAGAFTVQVQAFGRDNALLASFTQGGMFSAAADNSVPFVGIVDTAPDIYRISYTGLTPHADLFLNRFDIATRPAAPPVCHAHILWTNPDGRATLWYVNPDNSYGLIGAYGPYAGGTSPQAVIVGPGGAVWKAVAVATGPNGVSRLLWTNPDGRAALWYVNPDGSHSVSGVYGPYTDEGGLWTALGVSVGPNNVAHILWGNPDGRATLWYVNTDASYGLVGAYGPYVDGGGTWRAVAVATGPNGVSRLLWTHPDGRAVLWFVNPDGSYGDRGAYGPYADSGGVWKAGAVSVGPDNIAHILWGNPDGRTTLWYVNPDASYGLIGAYGPYADTGGVWMAAAVATGPDNVTRVLWGNPDGRATLWYVNPGGAYGLLGAYGPYVDSGGVWRATADSAGP